MKSNSAQRNPTQNNIEQERKTHLRLWLKLLKVTRRVEGELRENLRVEFDSTLPRFDVMAALNRFPQGLKMSELSGVLKVSNGNVTGIVDRLVRDGLVIRTAAANDRRVLIVQLTKRGDQDFLRQAAEHESWIDAMLGTISIDDAEKMINNFDHLIPYEPDEKDSAK